MTKRDLLRTLADALNPYSWVMAARNRAFDAGVLKSREFDVPTICVGNITVGGTGKTPHIEYIARLLKTSYAIAVLSRGYGRKSKGYIKAGRETTMEQIGDEPFQIKEKFSDIDVAVCEKRTEGIDRLVTGNKALQAVLLDDAFQHRHVKAGLNILLIDSNRPVWRDNVMPFGRLRESIGGISRADIVIFTKCKGVTAEQKSAYRSYIKEIKDIPVYFTTIRYGKPYPLFNSANTAMPQESRVLLVTGIANPQPLKAEIEERGAKVELMQYGDHHNFTDTDFDDIVKQFRNGGYTMIVTTEKDATRMKPHEETLKSIRDSIYVMPIEVEFLDGEEKLFNDNIYNYVTENSRDS
jgi:tetraacyldisaccharide 4'-kinase